MFNDAIGDYPIADALPLFIMKPHVSKQIRRAYITTKRSQADMTDNWVCTYIYNHIGRLKEVSVNAGNDLRYTKKVRYIGQKATDVVTYLNLESRHIVEQKVSYLTGKPHVIKWQDNSYEPGKDRTTKTSVTLMQKDFGKLPSIDLSFKEVLDLLKAKA